MNKEKFIFKCDVRGRAYQHGPGRHEGHRLELYGRIFCCDLCWQGNWDGWAPQDEHVLLEHLKQKNLPVPERNAKGWLPRD